MVQRQIIHEKVVVVHEAEATPKIRPIHPPPAKVPRSHRAIGVPEPYIQVELLVCPVDQLPRDLDETRLAFDRGEEDGIERVGARRFDFVAVLFVRSPVLQENVFFLGNKTI